MDVRNALAKLQDTVNKEKLQLDYILQGAQLLADMLLASEKQSGNEAEIKRSESGLEEAAGTGKREPV